MIPWPGVSEADRGCWQSAAKSHGRGPPHSWPRPWAVVPRSEPFPASGQFETGPSIRSKTATGIGPRVLVQWLRSVMR